MKDFDRDNTPWLRDAMKVATAVHRANTGEEPTMLQIVAGMLAGAAQTLQHVRDQERGWIYSLRALWPEIAIDRAQELENFKDLLERIKRGEESSEVLFGNVVPSPHEVARMDAVLEEMPKMIVGRDRRRDWKIVTCVARGLEKKVIARTAGCSPRSVYRQCEFQHRMIARRLAEMFPELVPAGTVVIR